MHRDTGKQQVPEKKLRPKSKFNHCIKSRYRMSLFDICIDNSECTKNPSIMFPLSSDIYLMSNAQRVTPYTPTVQHMTSTEMLPSKNLCVCAGLRNLKLHLPFPISLSCTQTFPENSHIDKA